jgi:hypothetical protein
MEVSPWTLISRYRPKLAWKILFIHGVEGWKLGFLRVRYVREVEWRRDRLLC